MNTQLVRLLIICIYSFTLVGCAMKVKPVKESIVAVAVESEQPIVISALAVQDVVHRYKGIENTELEGYEKLQDLYVKQKDIDVLMASIFKHNNNDKDIIIAIRGTMTPYEIQKDLEIIPVKFKDHNGVHKNDYGKTSRGFYQVYNKIRTDIMDYVQQCNNCQIDITGHSLGAAIASLAWYDIMLTEKHDADAVHLYAYAPPKIGNSQLTNNLKNLSHNDTKHNALFIINKHDIITKNPPGPVYSKYPEQYIQELCWKAEPLPPNKSVKTTIIEYITRNHHLTDYIAAIKRQLGIKYEHPNTLQYCSNT